MKGGVLWVLAVVTVHGGVVSREWRDARLSVVMDDGAAEVEWISATAFRFARSWGASGNAAPRIVHEAVEATFRDSGDAIALRTKYLTVEVEREDLRVRVRSGEMRVAEAAASHNGDGVELRLGVESGEKIFAGDEERGFFFTSKGYGILVRTPERTRFGLSSGIVEGPGSSIEFVFYYGPTPKDIFEQHRNVTGAVEVSERVLNVLAGNRLPREATPLAGVDLSSWDGLRALVGTLNRWSLSAVLYPALDLAGLDGAPDDVKQRALDLAAMLPVVYRSSGEGGIDRATREAWKPYLITYLREAYDRGIPLIRPLPVQFPRDSGTDQAADVFMLGDEMLLAPVLEKGDRRKVRLPRGTWTDFRTNHEYRGNQETEVEAPEGRVPIFVRNGWIVPVAVAAKIELHYFPSLGAEFFLWEPEANDNSQFHAAPAGDFVRVEIESKLPRTYEWVLHHTGAAKAVAEGSGTFERVSEKGLLRAGTWWHDAAQNNLHVMVRAEANSDRIVNISF
jgi:Glycosyl hydrolase family 31 C-terminal domain